MVDKSRFHVSSVDSAPSDSQDGFLYRNSFFSLSCPICLSKICGLASECNFHPNCNFCHEEDHLQEDGNQLIEYLKLDYSGEGKFSSSQNLMIAGLSTSNEIHDLVVNHIREYSVTVSSKKSESVPEVEYIDALICVAIKIDIDEETLQRLSNFDPDSIHWARKRGQDLIRPAEEIVSKYRDSTIPLNLETKESSVYDYIKESNNFLDEMNKSKIDSNSAKKIILIFSDGFNQYGVQRQLKFLMDCLHGKGFQHTIPEFDSWIISKWFAILISSTAQKQNISEHISLRVLENMETRAAESNEYWVAFQISQMILEKATFAKDDENQQNIFKRVLGYFEYLKDLTNYITYCRMIVDTGLTIEISFPDWIEEKLINLPEQIPKFDNLCEILNIEFDYSPIIQNLPKDSFANVLGINHLSKILATGDKINFSSSEGYSERMLIGGDGSQGNLINFESPLEEATGFTIDLPNLLYLTKDGSDNKTRMKEWITATNKIINWINQNQTPCYIHTTPTTCWAASECVNKIFKETNAYFLYYEFEDTKDEDLYFLSFSLRRNTWLVSQDKFRNHSSTIDSTILDSIGNRLFMPRYNPETEEIEFIKF